ncbi:hypothetical protein AAFF_G00329140 [Aldrovandia affinis]|uniref:Hepcidin n=1 Tax=Aldrovandia affinis TaxID=143900 RepID=A0AAD7SM15_9TELE|nr:hypothetical protein AAFF_G00329140 [Aldrovandia affinis]
MKMKSLCIVGVVVFLCICVLHCTALPYSEMRAQETGGSDVDGEEVQQTVATVEETDPLVLFRAKRESHISLCRYCCKCCRNKGCGFCCRF